MSRDIVTSRPKTPLSKAADLFRRHRFTSLPVVGQNAKFLVGHIQDPADQPVKRGCIAPKAFRLYSEATDKGEMRTTSERFTAFRENL
ncbi:CBS domain-containing protein [Roseovarius sp. B08]|uniref:CBS domain-containing protein n=1 Tax=Roseovarius sp. B08 TaxID=3449223 RepID=UPI003EDC1C8E